MEKAQTKLSTLIKLQGQKVIHEIFQHFLKRVPGKKEQCTDPQMEEHCRAAISRTLQNLLKSVSLKSPELFGDYMVWQKTTLAQHDIYKDELLVMLEGMEEIVHGKMDGLFQELIPFFYIGREQLQAPQNKVVFVDGNYRLGLLATQYFNSLFRAQRHLAGQLVQDAVAEGVDIRDIYLHVFQSTQYEVGRLWQINRISVAQEHYFSAATQMIMSQLYPYIFASEKNGFRFVGAGVSQELHEIGLRMVVDFLEMEGWDTYYLGPNAPQDTIHELVQKEKVDILGISVTMTYYVDKAKKLIESIRSDSDCESLKILVGGHPFNIDPFLWKKIGADGHARNALEAIEVAKKLVVG